MSSKFENLPPRIQLKSRDDEEGKYPTTSRSGNRTGAFSSTFNDTSTIIFDTNGNTTFPQMLPSSSQYISSTYILGNAIIRKGTSDSQITFSKNTPGFGPFKEDSLFALEETAFFLTGSEDDRFNAKLKDKVAITIDISAKEMSYHTRNATKRNNMFDPNGRFKNTDITGFSYFNFNLKKWEMIGLTDPETGQATHFDWAVRADVTTVSGTENFPSQFIPSNQSIGWDHAQTPTSLRAMAGLPTIANFAPISNKYHATSSQTLKMSTYIDKPFLLEKIVVKLPIQAEKMACSASFTGSLIYAQPQEDYVFFMYRQETSQNIIAGGTPLQLQINKSGQNNASGSTRYLICSGVMTFYNNNALVSPAVFVQGVWNFITASYSPSNTPTFQHDWNLTTASNARIDPQFTGSVELNIPIAVTSKYYYSPQEITIPIAAGDVLVNYMGTRLNHAWPGGTSCLPFGPKEIMGKFQDTDFSHLSFANTWYTQGAAYNTPPFVVGGVVPDQEAQMNNIKIETFDAHAKKMLGSTRNEKGINSQYVLLPGDEIIFGIEAALSLPSITNNSFINRGAENTTFMTGALLKIMPENASITFFGSYVQNDEIVDQGLPQFLTSDNIHENIHEMKKDSDEFLILSRQSLIGTYTDRVIVGNIFTTSTNPIDATDTWRQSQFFNSAAKRKYNLSGEILTFDMMIFNDFLPDFASKPDASVNVVTLYNRNRTRYNQLVDKNERFYDTLLPDFEDYLLANGAIHTSSYFYSSSAWIQESFVTNRLFKFPGNAVTSSDGNIFQNADLRYLENNSDALNAYPFKNDPTRKIQNSKVSLIFSQSLSSVLYQERVITSQEGISLLLFGRGFSHDASVGKDIMGYELSTTNNVHHKLIGSTGYKYGIKSIFPNFTTQTYRRDRYGNNRDMLEQRVFSTCYDDVGINSGKKGLNLGPINIRFQSSLTSSFCDPSLVSGSSNRSSTATSSMPYIDGEYFNWGTIL